MTAMLLHRRRSDLFGAIVGVAALCISCGGGAGETVVVEPTTVVAVDVSPGSASLGVFATASLTATAKDSKGNSVAGRAVGWSSSNPSLATVSTSGTITTIAAGSVTITATIDGKSGTAVVTIEPYITLQSLAAGGFHTCGLTLAGAAYCWGSNRFGELGLATSGVPHPAPTAVLGSLVFTSITAGYGHTCGLTTAGAAYCWGDNEYGQLGDGSTTERHSPVLVSGGLVFSKLSSGQDDTCGLTTAGTVYCWGENEAGALGDGTNVNRSAPVAAARVPTFVEIAAGAFHTCGLTANGTGYCWGANVAGQLGAPSSADGAPVAVSGGLSFAHLSAGAQYTCGLTPAGAAYCWGENEDATLGDGGGLSMRQSPALVVGGHVFSSVSTGSFHACGAMANGPTYCWGQNELGQLGDGTTTTRASPVAVLGGNVLSVLAIGASHTCGLSGGAVYCWGDNALGELGDGTQTNRPAPTRARNP